MISFSENENTFIEKAINAYHNESQFEIEILANIGYLKFQRLMKYHQRTNTNVNFSFTLDIALPQQQTKQHQTNNNYGNTRISISNVIMNEFLTNLLNGKKQYIDYLHSLSFENNDNIRIIKKNRGRDDKLYFKEYDISLKIAKETIVDDIKQYFNILQLVNPSSTDTVYRLKMRTSYFYHQYKIDITDVKQTNNPFDFINQNLKSTYEYEVELLRNENENNEINEQYLNNLLAETIALVNNTTIQGIMKISEKKEIQRKYAKLFGIKWKPAEGPSWKPPKIIQRNVISMEPQHVKFLPHNYAVTDKPDGERFFLFGIEGQVYLFDLNFNLYRTGYIIPDNEIFILDGELITITSNNNINNINNNFQFSVFSNQETVKQIYLSFDIVYGNGINYVTAPLNLQTRYNVIINLANTYFDGYVEFKNSLEQYWQDFNNHFQIEGNSFTKTVNPDEIVGGAMIKSEFLSITAKIYLFPEGNSPTEVFYFMVLFLENKHLAPYIPDGLICTPLNQSYLQEGTYDKETLDTVPREYKWKSSEFNTIDFFVEIKGDEIFGNDAGANDAIDVNTISNAEFKGLKLPQEKRIYKVLQLFVGRVSKNTRQNQNFNRNNQRINKKQSFRNQNNNNQKNNREFIIETPVPFIINGQNAFAFIPIRPEDIANNNLVARDEYGDIIQDHMVVECRYRITSDRNEDFRNNFIPLRIRYDKTQSTIELGKKFGNNEEPAYRILRSINNPFSETSLRLLANPDTFEDEYKRLIQQGKANMADSNTSQNMGIGTYFRVNKSEIVENTKGMRAIHNWIKGGLIEKYLIKGAIVLDLACGRGGDLHKFSNASRWIGVDEDYEAQYVIDRNASYRIDRILKKAKRERNQVPEFILITANAKYPFIPTLQSKILTLLPPTMKSENESLMTQYLSGNIKYDLINCQFALHYFMVDETSWNNFCLNLNTLLANKSTLLVTVFDGNIISNLLKNNDTYKVSYIDDTGEERTIMKIDKIFVDTNEKLMIGKMINVTNEIISNIPMAEAVVDPNFLVSEMNNKVGMTLKESATFLEVFNNCTQFFMNRVQNNKTQTNKTRNNRNNAIDNVLDTITEYYKNVLLGISTRPGSVSINAVQASFKIMSLYRYYVFTRERNNYVEGGSNNQIINQNNHDFCTLLMSYFNHTSLVLDRNSLFCSNDLVTVKNSLMESYGLDINQPIELYIIEPNGRVQMITYGIFNTSNICSMFMYCDIENEIYIPIKGSNSHLFTKDEGNQIFNNIVSRGNLLI